jgi:hypothetical protein
MHVHLTGRDHLELYLTQCITGVRDMRDYLTDTKVCVAPLDIGVISARLPRFSRWQQCGHPR